MRKLSRLSAKQTRAKYPAKLTQVVKTVILIGPPGSGKTSAGNALARLLDWSFIDTDRLIEKRCGASIEQIFQGSGEPAFRQLERIELEQLVEQAREGRLDRFVIGTGGGLPIAPGNYELLSRIGEVVCLRAPLEVLVERLSASTTRPLLASTGHESERQQQLTARLERLLDERDRHYKRAPLTIDTDEQAPEAVAATIVKLLNIST